MDLRRPFFFDFRFFRDGIRVFWVGAFGRMDSGLLLWMGKGMRRFFRVDIWVENGWGFWVRSS